jgi:acyl-CoA synthetase (AMP-forming)/AMP-acid ligase II
MPRSMIRRFIDEFGTIVLHSWGMTEMSPMGTVGTLLPKHKYNGQPCRH